MNEGKCTISFVLPEIDLQIKADPIQLKAFLNVMKTELCPSTKESPMESPKSSDNKLIRAFGNTNKMLTDQVLKLNITSRADFSTKGFPRTLKELHITGVGCLQMPIGILNLINLSYLNLASNSISKLHKALGNLKIKQLIVSENQLGESTNTKDWEWLNGENLRMSLQLLNISKNKLKVFPVEIAKCNNLTSLDMSCNEISKLPFAIKQLKQLRQLNLSNNQLKSLPCTIRKLQLDLIDLSNCQFPSYTNSLELSHNSLNSVRNRTTIYFDFPTLFELSARKTIKSQIPFINQNIPQIIKEILFQSPICANTKCENFCFDRTIYNNINLTSIASKSRITSDNANVFLMDGPICTYACLKKN